MDRSREDRRYPMTQGDSMADSILSPCAANVKKIIKKV